MQRGGCGPVTTCCGDATTVISSIIPTGISAPVTTTPISAITAITTCVVGCGSNITFSFICSLVNKQQNPIHAKAIAFMFDYIDGILGGRIQKIKRAHRFEAPAVKIGNH
jgi:hypothetical protein